MLAAATLLIRPFMDFFRASQDSLWYSTLQSKYHIVYEEELK